MRMRLEAANNSLKDWSVTTLGAVCGELRCSAGLLDKYATV